MTLNLYDRKIIKKIHKAGKSLRTIASYIGCDPSTISREIRRNKETYWYHLIHAQKKTFSVGETCRRDVKKCKIDINSDLGRI